MGDGRVLQNGRERISFLGAVVVTERSCVAHCLQILRCRKRGAICVMSCCVRDGSTVVRR